MKIKGAIKTGKKVSEKLCKKVCEQLKSICFKGDKK